MTAHSRYLQVWSIQTQEAYEAFLVDGVIEAHWRRVANEDRAAYLWMVGKMWRLLKRWNIETAGPPKPPMWSWLRWSSRTQRPDLRATNHLPAGTKGVRIELQIPVTECVVSNFDTWHQVLNRLSGIDIELGSLDDVLDLDLLISSDQIRTADVVTVPSSRIGWVATAESIQVCTPFLRKSWMVDTTFFTAR